MPGLSVDGSGNVTGTIELQDGDLVIGQHEINIAGSAGTVAKAIYNNNPTSSLEDLRKVFITSSTDALTPMAQTFKVNEERDLIAVKLDLDIGAGTDDVVVQIREVDGGSPSPSKILAESRVTYDNVQALGTWTRFDLSPTVPLLTDREYSINILTNNVDYTIAVAELGGTDLVTGDAIASQPNAGTLQTSSNGTAWSIEQSKDLKFQLVGATYATTTKEVNLGVVTGTDISDFLVLANAQISDKDSQVSFVVTDPAANTYSIDKDQKFTLGAKQTGDFALKAVLQGSTLKSPIVFPNSELILGEINASGVYHSKKFTVPNAFGVKFIIEAKLLGSGSYTPAIEDTTLDNYTNLTLSSSETMPDGWIRSTWTAAGITEVGTSNLSSIRITATSPSVASRVFLRNLIVFTE